MAEFKIEIAGKCIKVNSLFDYVRDYCKEFFSEKEPDFCVSIERKDIENERKKTIEEEQKGNIDHFDYKDDYLEILAVYRKIVAKMLDYDTLLMHGAVIAVDGQAYMFTAKSGTGKTTHIRLWHKKFGDRMKVINGDKPLIKVTENGVIAYGTPWCGKERYGNNACAPLKAVCVLQRSKENHIKQVEMGDILHIMLQQSYRGENASETLAVLSLLDGISKGVKFYVLGCNMESQAADVAYNGMQ